MTIFFQHVGETLGLRDFPRTIGKRGELRLFQVNHVEQFLDHLPKWERERLAADCLRNAPAGFQIWGFPSGAAIALRRMTSGDVVLLLESANFGGGFYYGGRVIARLSEPCPDLSAHLWGEGKFPLIVFLLGKLTNYTWSDFCKAVHYSENYNPRGNTSRIPPKTLAASDYVNEAGLLKAMFGSDGF